MTHGVCGACGKSTEIEPFHWADGHWDELLMLCGSCWDVASDLYEGLTGQVYGDVADHDLAVADELTREAEDLGLYDD